MHTSIALEILSQKLKHATIAIAQENSSKDGITPASLRFEWRLRRAVKYLKVRLVRPSNCQGAGVECPCPNDHGDRHDRKEWNHI